MGTSLLIGALGTAQLWYALPLIVVISLVYGATRDESLTGILGASIRAGAWLVCFLAIIFAIVVWLSWGL